MDLEQVKEWCEAQDKSKTIEIPEYLYDELNKEQAAYIAKYFNYNALIKLPEYEIEFYDWLKKEDPEVWHDLWNDKDAEPYVVAVSFLPLLIKEVKRGFPICDLIECTNFFFTEAHMTDEESKVYIETSKTRFIEKQGLTVPQLLALEISMDPIDIWHFAYKHRLELDDAKKAVQSLVDDNALVHFKDAEYLAQFVDF